jgi:hypothetical protein
VIADIPLSRPVPQEPKRLGLLQEHFPHVTLFGALINPKRQTSADQALELTEAVRKISRPVVILNASTDAELENLVAMRQ